MVTLLNTIWGLINVGSSTAFNAITSVSVVGLFSTYAMAIALFALHKWKGKETINYGPWSMGKYGILVNIASVAFVVFICIFSLFPAYQPVTALNMNYASVLFGFVLSLTAVAWLSYGSQRFKGPIRETLAERAEFR